MPRQLSLLPPSEWRENKTTPIWPIHRCVDEAIAAGDKEPRWYIGWGKNGQGVGIHAGNCPRVEADRLLAKQP